MQDAQYPLYGRKWEIKVALLPDPRGQSEVLTVSSSAFEPEALRATFDIQQQAHEAFWYGDIAMYNIDGPTTDKIMRAGSEVEVWAGYQNGNYGRIFHGRLLQPMWERENVTDYKLTLHCLTGKIPANFISFSENAGLTAQADILRRIMEESTDAIPAASITNLKSTVLPRGVTVFGSPYDEIDNIADENNCQWWVNEDGLSMGTADEIQDSAQALVYTPTTGIVGTPRQTQEGVELRVLLDPRVVISRVRQQIKIDQSSIRARAVQVGQYQAILDADGTYAVYGIHHYGDTRGNNWYTEIIGLTTAIGKLAMLGDTDAADQDRVDLNAPGPGGK